MNTPWTMARIFSALLSMAIVVAVLVAFVSVKNAQMQAGYRVHDLRVEIAALRARTDALAVEYGSLTRPARLARVAVEELQLVPTTVEVPR
jgi:cell division protein FtsL